jgi:hypothetical protein
MCKDLQLTCICSWTPTSDVDYVACRFEICLHAQAHNSDSVRTGVCFQKGTTGMYGNSAETGMAFYFLLNPQSA